jgi:hypothetical protein
VHHPGLRCIDWLIRLPGLCLVPFLMADIVRHSGLHCIDWVIRLLGLWLVSLPVDASCAIQVCFALTGSDAISGYGLFHFGLMHRAPSRAAWH